MTAAGLSCGPSQAPGAPVSTPAPMAPAPGAPASSPDGTAAATAGASEPQTPPAAAVVPAPARVPAEPPAAAPPVEESPEPVAAPPAREPKMEWREAPARTAEERESLDANGKRVFTNADLARFAKAEDAAPNDAAAADRKAQEAFDKASVKKVQDLPATEAWKAKTKADAEARVRASEAKLEALRRLSQSDSNPLLPQPILSSEEQQKRAGLSAEQRYKLTQQEIQQAEQELADAKADLARILKNFAPPR